MDLKVIEYVSILDERGFFKKMFSQKKLENLVGNKTIKQVNKTFTKKKVQFVAYISNIHHIRKLKLYLV